MLEIKKNRFHQLIREGDYQTFNRELEQLTEPVDLSNCDLSNLDLRKFNLRRANLTDSYLKLADLRGVDLSEANLRGASLNRAHISGAFFPPQIHASEIRLSVEYGTRLRYREQ